MLSISFNASPQRLPYAGFALAIPSKSRGLPLKKKQIAQPVSRRPVNPTGRKQTERSRFKRLEPILRNRQLCLFRLFNEACGDLGMQPSSHLLPSKPFHPLIGAQEPGGQNPFLHCYRAEYRCLYNWIARLSASFFISSRLS